MPSPQGPLIGVKTFKIGGLFTAFDLTAAAVIKSSPGVCMRFIISNAGTTGGNWTLNDANALVTAQNVSAITQANPGVVTISTGGGSNPFAVGNTIAFASIGGMTQLNSLYGTVTAIGGVTTAWTITLNINTTNFTTYTSGGTVASFSAANQIFTLAESATLNVAGTVVALEAATTQGILLSAVPSGGTPIATVTYD